MEVAARLRERWHPPEGLGIALGAVAIYFGVALVPKVWPAFAGGTGFLLYILSTLVVLAGVVSLVLWGLIDVVVSRLRKLRTATNPYWTLGVGLWGLLMCACAVTLSRSIQGALPTGSHLAQFDSAAWKHPKSADWSTNDITTRQKMLGSVVRRLTPSQSRAEIEGLLGPSLQTRYFQSSGRDLIYRTGMQRDSLLGIDSEWLLIWLDDDGKFERYAIYTD